MSFALSVFFFFFKQKTAYEMRISDWSSDVCSSDLTGHGGGPDGTCWLNTAGSNHSDPGFRASRYYPDIPLGLCLRNGNVRACFAGLPAPMAARPDLRLPAPARAWHPAPGRSAPGPKPSTAADRKTAVWGKRVYERVEHGGGR